MTFESFQNRFFWLLTVAVLGFYAFFSALAYIATRSYSVAEFCWPLVILICAVSPAVSPEQISTSLIHLCRGIALVAFIYIFLQIPYYPVINDGFYTSVYSNLLAWTGALIATGLAWRNPKWLLVVGFYMPWVKAIADHATGFTYHNVLDIIPLYQMLKFCGATVIVIGFWLKLVGYFETTPAPSAVQALELVPPQKRDGFTRIISLWMVFVLICFHFAGYFFSGVAKATLDGGFWYWPLSNELQNIYFAAVANQQMIWLDIPGATAFFTGVMDWIGRPMSLLVFFGQLLAVIAFSSRRWLIFLLLFYDVMHVGIFVSQGANFFTWAMVNIAVIAAIRAMPASFFGLKPVLVSIVIMVFAQFVFNKFYRVPNLGWYDSKALNSGYFVANTKQDETIRVPNAFFTFYSYPVSHMSYGHPEGLYFPTDTNGGTKFVDINEKASRCEFTDDELLSTKKDYWDGPAVMKYIQHHHLQMEQLFNYGVPLWLNIYWHHFWSPLSLHNEFKQLSLSDVKSYTLVIESMCLEREGLNPEQSTVLTNRMNIPINR